MNIAKQLEQNLSRIRQRISEAAIRAGRDPSDVTLVAVTKSAELEWIRALVDLGVTQLAESRPQQLSARARELPERVTWHLIGHLQRNKVDLVLPVVTWLHTVDSIRLAEAVDRFAAKRGSPAQVLLEVNISGEASKGGFAVEELQQAWPTLEALPNLSVSGFMTMAPLSDTPETARPVFRGLRELRDQFAAAGSKPLPELSMGMSGDFEIGIEEGATFVRVGSALFEGLDR